MDSQPSRASQCERRGSNPQASFEAPDPKTSTPPTQEPNEGQGPRTDPHQSAPSRAGYVIAGVIPAQGEDTPDVESPVAWNWNLASVPLWVFALPGMALLRPSTPPAPAQGPHSAEPIHDSAQGELPSTLTRETGA